MTKEEAALVLENLAIFIKDSFRFMRPEHIEQFKEAYNLAIKALKEPAADVQEVKHGKWIDKGHFTLMCSCCEEYVARNVLYGYKLDYCPKCGAKMDGKEEGNGSI